MKQEYLEWCGGLKIKFFSSDKLLSRNKRVGFVVFKDNMGSIFPFYTFETTQNEKTVTFPAVTINDQERDVLSAASYKLCELWQDAGIMTISYAIQPDGMDYAVLEMEEGLTALSEAACRAFGLDVETVLERLKNEPTMAFLGYLPEPDRFFVWEDGDAG